MCFHPPILLGAPCCAWGPKQGRRKILSGPCRESLAGLANSASPGCNGLNQTQLASLEILCTTTSFTSEAKPHKLPPPMLPTPQGTAEHGSSLPLHTKPRVSDTPTSHNRVLLLLSQAAFSLPSSPFSLSSFLLNTGQGRGQQQSCLCLTRRFNTLALCRRQARELASPSPYHLSQQFFTFPSHLLQKSYTFFSAKIRGMKTARFIRVNMSVWWHNYCHSSLFRGYLITLRSNIFQDVMQMQTNTHVWS